MFPRALLLPLAAIVLAVLHVACDGSTRPLQAVALAPTASPVILPTIQPQTITINRAPFGGGGAGGACTSAFDVSVREQTGADLFLNQVSMRLLDGSSLWVSPLLFTGPALTRIFPTVFIPAFSTGTFRFAPDFGCRFGVSGLPSTLVIDMVLLDRAGVPHTATTSASVR
jgi:hypothetical protein